MKMDQNYDAKLPNEVRLWDFMVDNYVALKNEKLSQDQLNSLNDVFPGWIEHVEAELISVHDECRKEILDER
ncbi:MAG: hypothetical protein PHE60_05735 [Sulfurospirillaceae bacterium]|nr:hypothetical protein [Sulfurospirillaceae bacterium]